MEQPVPLRADESVLRDPARSTGHQVRTPPPVPGPHRAPPRVIHGARVTRAAGPVRGHLGTRLVHSLGVFVLELRRRHVVRVTLVYLAVAWGVAQVSATLFPVLGIPAWSVRLVTVLLLLGLPLAAVLAWAFDLTAHGVQRTSGRVAAGVNPRRGVPAVLALPFVDRGGAHQHLGDGITEELINSLARLPGIRVVSRTTAFALRTAGADLRELGTGLGVTHVVEGSIGVAEGRLRLTVQLVCVTDGYAIWSRTFDRALADAFCAQQEIAAALVDALCHALLPAAPARPAA